MNQELLLKIKKYRIPFKDVNQKIAVEYLPNWKKEYVEITEINEMVARQLLYTISEDLFGKVNEIEFKNRIKKPSNHFQMEMYLDEYILSTSPFICVDDNHKIVSKNTKINILNYDYNDVAILKENELKGGKADKITTLDDLYNHWSNIGYKSGGISKSLKKQLKQQIEKGIKIEMEHTSDVKKATEIVMDHLTEFPDYYDRLEKMEKDGRKELKINETKKLIKHLLRENLEIDEEFIIKHNTIFFTEPFDGIKSFNIGNRKVYALFGEIDYYSGNNKEAIKAIKNISNIITKNPKSYSNLLKEFNKRFNTIPELASSEKLLGVETSSPVISDLSNVTNKPFINNAFTKIDKTLRMKNIDLKDREKISNLFELSFDLNDNSKVCVIDDFMTTGTSFKNAFSLIPQEIEAIGVCLFKLIS